MRRYYLHLRKGIYYAELVSPEGHRLTARSTGKTTEDEALLVVSKWLSEGIPTKSGKNQLIEAVVGLSDILKAIRKADLDGNGAIGNGAKLFTEFLEEFWNYEVSPYIKEKLAHGHSIGRRHCAESLKRVHLFYKTYFKERPLNSITRADLKAFSLALTEKKEKPVERKGNFVEKLSPSYINKVLITGTTALAWAHREGIIPVDPSEGLVRFSGAPKKRGVLTPKEAEAVFKVHWKDKRAYIGNLLSLTTGLRAGEVLALRKSDIGDTVLFIRHNWSSMDRLKSPKNGEERRVPLLPAVKMKLLELLADNSHIPHIDPAIEPPVVVPVTPEITDPFIFYSTLPKQPMDQKFLIDGLRAACEAVKIDAKARNIVFHSWRHFYAAQMADRMKPEEIMRVGGWKTKGVFDDYQDHILEEHIAKVGEVFGNILQFKPAI